MGLVLHAQVTGQSRWVSLGVHHVMESPWAPDQNNPKKGLDHTATGKLEFSSIGPRRERRLERRRYRVNSQNTPVVYVHRTTKPRRASHRIVIGPYPQSSACSPPSCRCLSCPRTSCSSVRDRRTHAPRAVGRICSGEAHLIKSASSGLDALSGGVAPAWGFLLPPAMAYDVPKSVPSVSMASWRRKSQHRRLNGCRRSRSGSLSASCRVQLGGRD